MRIDRPYLMIPQRGDKRDAAYRVTARADGRTLFEQELAAVPGEPVHWSVVDLSAYLGSDLEIMLAPEGHSEQARELFRQVALTDDVCRFVPDLYREADRPQFHFSYRTGVLGDPTAMIYYAPRKEWHLFTISNPLRGREICWGHAVSLDLMHWEERPPVFHHPHYIYNGIGFVDSGNLLGLNADGRQAIVLLTPIMDRPGGNVSMTVSVDEGGTFHDLNDLAESLNRPDLKVNPICPGWGDAPRCWWNPAVKRFFLTHCRWGKKDGKQTHASLQYTSSDLKTWTRHPKDFPLLIYANWPGEGDACDVVELPVDDDPDNRVLLVSCGLNGYALARYSADGLSNLAGEPLSPKDTIRTGHRGFPIIFSHAPGGRAVMMLNVGNAYRAGIPNFEVGYKPNLSVPLELSLRTTPDGIRLFKNPVRELELLHGKAHKLANIPLARDPTAIPGPAGGLYRIRATVDTGSAESIGLRIRGHELVCDVGERTFRGHEPGIPFEKGAVTLEVLVDRTSLEVFGGEGAAFFYEGKLKLYEFAGEHDLELWADGGEAAIKSIEVIELSPIWSRKAC